MSSNPYWDPNKFEEDIGFLISQFNSLFLADVNELLGNPKGDRKNSMKGLASLDLVTVQKQLHEVIYKIEDELRRYALLCLSEHNFSEEVANHFLDDQFYSSFIKSPIIDELNSTLNQLKDLTVLAKAHLYILEKNSGVGGFFKGLFKGYTNPVDGVSHAFGQGSMQVEVSSSVQGFNTSAFLVGQSIDTVSNSLKLVVLEKWNRFGAALESHLS